VDLFQDDGFEMTSSNNMDFSQSGTQRPSTQMDHPVSSQAMDVDVDMVS
jgi:hypothetical protein